MKWQLINEQVYTLVCYICEYKPKQVHVFFQVQMEKLYCIESMHFIEQHVCH